ncbi:MAG: hypothetical protein ACI4N5_01995 [Christensenellales bacterium]
MKGLDLVKLAMETNPNLTANDGTLNYIPIFKLIIVLYLLYVAALGKGKILENKHIKIERKKFNLYMRLIAGLGALLVLANAAFEYFCYENATLQVIGVVLWWAGLAALVGLMVFSAVMTDRAALASEQKAKDEEMIRKQQEKMRSAFVFDDEDDDKDDSNSNSDGE